MGCKLPAYQIYILQLEIDRSLPKTIDCRTRSTREASAELNDFLDLPPEGRKVQRDRNIIRVDVEEMLPEASVLLVVVLGLHDGDLDTRMHVHGGRLLVGSGLNSSREHVHGGRFLVGSGLNSNREHVHDDRLLVGRHGEG